eukprot:scaffold3166_cov399-Prasinococcus_capsulatus_cf.AAC.32
MCDIRAHPPELRLCRVALTINKREIMIIRRSMKKAITNRLKSLDAGRLPLGASSGEILLLLLDLNIFPFFDRPLDFRGEDGPAG